MRRGSCAVPRNSVSGGAFKARPNWPIGPAQGNNVNRWTRPRDRKEWGQRGHNAPSRTLPIPLVSGYYVARDFRFPFGDFRKKNVFLWVDEKFHYQKRSGAALFSGEVLWGETSLYLRRGGAAGRQKKKNPGTNGLHPRRFFERTGWEKPFQAVSGGGALAKFHV